MFLFINIIYVCLWRDPISLWLKIFIIIIIIIHCISLKIWNSTVPELLVSANSLYQLLLMQRESLSSLLKAKNMIK